MSKIEIIGMALGIPAMIIMVAVGLLVAMILKSDATGSDRFDDGIDRRWEDR